MTGLTLDRRTSLPNDTRVQSGTPRAPLHFLGLACAIGVSTIYFNQPLLVEMGKTYGAPAGQVMFVAGATQVGYALGLLLFVPLGDVLERRALMMRMYAAVMVALLLVSLAPTLAWLIAGSVVLGMVASVTHIVLPIAPDLVRRQRARAGDRHGDDGSAAGHPAGADLCGLGEQAFRRCSCMLRTSFRTGRVLDHGRLAIRVCHRGAGQCGVSAAAGAGDAEAAAEAGPALRRGDAVAVDAVADAAAAARVQPDRRAGVCLVQLLLDDAGVSAEQPLRARRGRRGELRPGGRSGRAGRADRGQAGGQARHALGADGGDYGAGALVCAAVGRRTSRGLSFAVHIAVLLVGVILLDVGAQLTQVGNQTRIFGLVPSARSRLNTVYMTVYFAGAAVGSALSTIAWERWKWNGVCGWRWD